MNRSYLIIFVPAALVAAGYLGVTHALGIHLGLTRFLLAGAGFLAAALIVRWYQRRKARAARI